MCNILVSACLLGVNCRYNGEVKENRNVIKLLHRKGMHLIPVCPEQMGGLATPRDAAEIQEDGSVVTKNGKDVTREYCRGAEEVLKIARLYQCDMAIMKERSPSCGYGRVYDGTFSGTLTDGDGITSGALIKHGIDVFGESELDQLLEVLDYGAPK